MSGSGGGGGGPGVPTTDCASLVQRTALNSPDPTVLANLKVKDALEVRFRIPGQTMIGAFTADGALAGTITYAGVTRLAKCLADGFKYVGLVLKIDGGECQIEIRPEAS
jgi:hypothetical protein